MNRSKAYWLLALVVVGAMILGACQPAGETAAPATEDTGTSAASEGSSAEAPAADGEITRAPVMRFPLLADLTSTNVWNLYDNAGSTFWNYVPLNWQWPTLLGQSDQRYDLIPVLAADIPGPITQDGDFYVGTVVLKEGLTWSDGTPVIAEDVAFTVNTVLAFNLLGNWIGFYDPSFLDHVEAVDDLTVNFYFSQQPGLPTWQYGALVGVVVCSTYWQPLVQPLLDELSALDPNGDEYATELANIVATLESIDPAGEPTFGAYKLSEWEAGAYVNIVADPTYPFAGQYVEEYANGAYRSVNPDGSFEWVGYGDPTGDMVLNYQSGPYFDSVLYTLYEVDTAVLALQNNDLDAYLDVSGLPQGFVSQLSTDPNITLVRNVQNGFRYMGFNFARPYFQGEAGAALRQAIACQLDLDFLSSSVLQNQVSPVYSLVPSENPQGWFNPEAGGYCMGMTTQERFTEAMRILTDAGFTWTTPPAWNENRGGSVDYGEGLTMPDGTVVPEFTLMAPNAGYDPLRATSAVYIEQWMRQLGIPVVAELTNFNNIINAVYGTGEYDTFILGWGLSIFPGYLCSFFGNGDPTLNSYSYDSPALQEACGRFYTEPDWDASQTIVDEIQLILSNDLPYITLFTNPIYDAYRNVTYPYTEVFDGISGGLYGAPILVMPATAQ